MKLILSVGKKILKKINIDKLFELIELYDENKYISGIEIMTSDYEYLEKYANKCKEKNLIFQCHAPKTSDSEDTYNYLKEINKISENLNKKINIVFHSVESENIENSIEKTNYCMKKITEFVGQNKLNLSISLENLNYLHGIKRINVDNIDKILMINKELKYTYDMGHDIFDNKKATLMTQIQKERLNNIHIHWYIENEDHHPILLENTNIEVINLGLKMLRDINYDGNIVLEYGIDFMQGDTYEEKMITYIKSFKIIEKLINNI